MRLFSLIIVAYTSMNFTCEQVPLLYNNRFFMSILRKLVTLSCLVSVSEIGVYQPLDVEFFCSCAKEDHKA